MSFCRLEYLLDSKGETLLLAVISQTQLDIVTNSYQPNLIKMSEHQTRGFSSKIHIKSSKLRVPCNFANFLSNGENKERMVQIMFSTLQEK